MLGSTVDDDGDAILDARRLNVEECGGSSDLKAFRVAAPTKLTQSPVKSSKLPAKYPPLTSLASSGQILETDYSRRKDGERSSRLHVIVYKLQR